MNIRRTTRSGSAFGLALLLALLHTVLLPAESEAQVLDRLRQQAQQAREEVEELLANSVRCSFDDAECVEKAKAEQKPVVLTDNDGKVLTDEEGKLITDTEELPAGMQTQAAQADGSRPAQQAAQEPLEDGRWVATFTSDAGVQNFSGPAYKLTSEAGARHGIFGIAFCDDNPRGPDMSVRANASRLTPPVEEGERNSVSVFRMRIPGQLAMLSTFADATITSVTETMVIGSISGTFRYRADGAQQSALFEGQFRAMIVPDVGVAEEIGRSSHCTM